MSGDGVVVHLQGHRDSRGVRLPEGMADRIASWAAGCGDDAVVTDSLPHTAPRLGLPVELVCGVLVLPLPEGQYVVWFRGEAVRDGIALLGQALHEFRDRPVAELSDEVLARILPAVVEDDVALVAVRLRPRAD